MLNNRLFWTIGVTLIFILAKPANARADFTLFVGAGYEEGGFFDHRSTFGDQVTNISAHLTAHYDNTSEATASLSFDQTQIGLSLTNSIGLHFAASATPTGNSGFTSIALAELGFTDSLSVGVLPIDPLALFAPYLIARISIHASVHGDAEAGINITSGDTSRDWTGGPFLDVGLEFHKDGFVYTTDPFTLTAFASARGVGPDGSGEADLNHTVRIEGFMLLDEAGNPIPATFTSNSYGFNYRDLSQSSPATVPEPSGLALAVLGMLGMCAVRLRA